MSWKKTLAIGLGLFLAAGVAFGSYVPQSAAIVAGFGLMLSGGTMSISSTAPAMDCSDTFNLGLSASVATNALTINVTTAAGATPSSTSPIVACFNAASVSPAVPVYASITGPLSIVIPSTATLGTVSAVPARVWVWLQYNGGVPALAVATCSQTSGTSNSSIYPCKRFATTAQTVTAITTGSTSPGVLYGTAVATEQSRLIGYVEMTEATAGTWATAPSALVVASKATPQPGDTLQHVESGSTSASQAITSLNTLTTFTASEISITPTSSVNLVQISEFFLAQSVPTGGGYCYLQWALYKASPSTSLYHANMGTSTSANDIFSGQGILLNDNPATGSSVTYQIAWELEYNISCTGTLFYPHAELAEIMG